MNIYILLKQTIKITVFFALTSVFALLINQQVYASSITATDLHSFANQERANVGLSPLSLNSKLNSAANAKADHMIINNYWSHFAPDGTTPWSFIVSSGYQYTTAGENLAKGFETSSAVIAGWMASSTHKDNVLGTAYTDVGYAIVDGSLLGSDTTLVVAMYGAKSAPAVANSVTIGAVVLDHGQGSGETPILAQESRKPSDQGVVAGIMSFIPSSVSQFKSLDGGLKLLILILSIIILVVAIRYILYSHKDLSGNKCIWFNKRPFVGSFILGLAFIISAFSGIGSSI
jgi:hypothetical protein